MSNTDSLTTAQNYIASGLSVIPIKTDGSKGPDLPSWKQYQSRLAWPSELESWFNNGHRPGIAIIAGKVSGGLEVIDFDAPELVAPWLKAVEEALPFLLGTLPMVTTPTGGLHVFYRCATFQGNQKLAQSADGKKTLIETRGEGGYVLTVGSPANCHPSGKPYTLTHGSLEAIPTITEAERDVLLDCARAFNEAQPQARPLVPPKPKAQGQPKTPGEEFNERGRVRDVLERHGWQYLRPGPKGELWARPGVNHASATLYPDGGLYVFSSNAAPFDSGRVYDPFGVYARLEHGGDFKAATKKLGEYLNGPAEEIELEIEETSDQPRLTSGGPQPTPSDSDPDDPDSDPVLNSLSMGEFMNTIFPTPRPVLRGLYGGDWGLVVGIGSVGKTTFMNGLVTALTAGRPFEPFIPNGAGPKRVLYLDWESNPFRLQNQMDAIRGELTDAELARCDANFRILIEPEVNGAPMRLTDAAHLKLLAKAMKQMQIDLLVVDTLAQACALNDENSNSEVQSKVVVPMRRLARYTGAAILLLHHEGKGKAQGGENYTQYRMRGASALIDGARYSITIVPKEKDKKFPVEVKCSKDKGGGFPDVLMRLDEDTRWFVATEAPPNVGLDQLILELLETHGEMETAEIAKLFPAYTLRRIQQKLKELTMFGSIIKTGYGKFQANFNRPLPIEETAPESAET